MKSFLFYLSNWIYLWYLLYKLNVIKTSPCLAYFIIFIFIIMTIVKKMKTNEIKNKNIKQQTNKYISTLLLYLLLIITIDIYPLTNINYEITINSIIIFCGILFTYFMFINYNGYNIYNIVDFYNMLTFRYVSSITPLDFIKYYIGI